MRVLLTIEYDGTNYVGWQRQDNGLAIQQVVEETVAQAQGQSVLFASGRTDAGVHAWGQKAHFDSRCTLPPEKWAFFLNDRLPEDIRIVKSEGVDRDFHARYWAKDKTYEYVIHHSRVSSAIRRNHCCFVPYELDFCAMKAAAGLLTGEHDFGAFASTRSNKQITVRKIHEVGFSQEGETIRFVVRGNGFLHNMVRIMAGSIVDIGRGRIAPDAFVRAFASRDRNELGCTAPARGLFLKDVTFYDRAQMGERAAPKRLEERG